jgi:hypothetical protein
MAIGLAFNIGQGIAVGWPWRVPSWLVLLILVLAGAHPARAELLLSADAERPQWQATATDRLLAEGCRPAAADRSPATGEACALPAWEQPQGLPAAVIVAILGNRLTAFFPPGIDPAMDPTVAALAELPDAKRADVVRSHWIDASAAMSIWRVEDLFATGRPMSYLAPRGAVGRSQVGDIISASRLSPETLGWFRLPDQLDDTWGTYGLIPGEPVGADHATVRLGELAPPLVRVPTLPVQDVNETRSPVFGPGDFVEAEPILFRLLQIDHRHPDGQR